MDVGVALGLFLLVFFVWGIPVIFVLTDPSIVNREKAIWVLAIGLASWIGWLVYSYVAPILPRQNIYDFDEETQVPPTL